MRAFLIFLSSLAIPAGPFYASPRPLPDPREATPVVAVDDSLARLAFSLSTPKGALSGILITKRAGDNIAGSMVNEFGISALDFSFSIPKRKMRLLNVVSFLDKWYIRRTLSSDLRSSLSILYGLDAKIPGYIHVSQSGDTLTLLNTRHNLRYSFSPLPPSDIYDPTPAPSEYDTL